MMPLTKSSFEATLSSLRWPRQAMELRRKVKNYIAREGEWAEEFQINISQMARSAWTLSSKTSIPIPRQRSYFITIQ